jgi:hypothetical protein
VTIYIEVLDGAIEKKPKRTAATGKQKIIDKEPFFKTVEK